MPPILGVVPSKSLGMFVEEVFVRLGDLVGHFLLEPGCCTSVSTHVIGVELGPPPSICFISVAGGTSGILSILLDSFRV